MTFVAEGRGGRHVPAALASAGGEYHCLECGGRVFHRRAHRRNGEFVSPHFFHPGDSTCAGGGGESEEHQWMKSLALAKAQQRWPNATVQLEVDLGRIRVDVLVDYPQTTENHGEGIAIECQYSNKEKDIGYTTRHCWDKEYSILWLLYSQFNSITDSLKTGYFYNWKFRDATRDAAIANASWKWIEGPDSIESHGGLRKTADRWEVRRLLKEGYSDKDIVKWYRKYPNVSKSEIDKTINLVRLHNGWDSQ